MYRLIIMPVKLLLHAAECDVYLRRYQARVSIGASVTLFAHHLQIDAILIMTHSLRYMARPVLPRFRSLKLSMLVWRGVFCIRGEDENHAVHYYSSPR